MDGPGFDSFAKALAQPGTPRRRVLKLLAGGVLAGVAAGKRVETAPGRSLRQGDFTPTPAPQSTATPSPTPVPTCPCPCPPIDCPTGRILDPATCQCRCPEVTCPVGQDLDPSTCQCRCPCPCPHVECPPGQSQNPETCQSDCLAQHMVCGDVCCLIGQLCDSGQCRDGGV
jgi:hypothetical protein